MATLFTDKVLIGSSLVVMLMALCLDAQRTSATNVRPLAGQTAPKTPSEKPGERTLQPTATSSGRGSKSYGYQDLYYGDKGIGDFIYWIPLVIVFGAGIIFLPVLGALFATLAASTAGAAVTTATVTGRRRRRDLFPQGRIIQTLRALEDAFEKFRSFS